MVSLIQLPDLVRRRELVVWADVRVETLDNLLNLLLGLGNLVQHRTIVVTVSESACQVIPSIHYQQCGPILVVSEVSLRLDITRLSADSVCIHAFKPFTDCLSQAFANL